MLLLADAGRDGGLRDWTAHAAFAAVVFALLALARLAAQGMPTGHHLAWAAGLQAFALAPHALPGARHAGWTEAFLLHASVGRLGGSPLAWLVAAVVASAACGWVWSRWRRARRLEVAAGMAPGYGLGGDALIRPQRPPNLGTLAFSATETSASHDVLLLHGLAASRRVWEPVDRVLDEDGVANLRPDLLGFGASRSIGTRFGLEDHVTAL